MTAETRAVVPCGPCSACCRFAITPVSVEEQAREHYEAEVREVSGIGKAWTLKRRPDGSCVYLVENRCSIWERAPWTCRDFDCRVTAARTPRPERRRMAKASPVWREVFAAAATRIETLKDDLVELNRKIRGDPA